MIDLVKGAKKVVEIYNSGQDKWEVEYIELNNYIIRWIVKIKYIGVDKHKDHNNSRICTPINFYEWVHNNEYGVYEVFELYNFDINQFLISKQPEEIIEYLVREK